MESRIVNTMNGLDGLLPLISRFHRSLDYYYPMSGFVAHLANHLTNPFFRIWGIYDEKTPVGYLIGSIEINYSVMECCLVDAYMEKANDEITGIVFREAIQWAKESGCKRITCYSKRDEALARKYGFEKQSTFLAREI